MALTTDPILPLFPDLLEQNDNGFGTTRHKVYSLDSVARRGSPESELRGVVVIYEAPNTYIPPERRCWRVYVEHHYYPFVTVGKKRICMHRSRRTERRFAARAEAVLLAERLVAAVQRVRESYARADQCAEEEDQT